MVDEVIDRYGKLPLELENLLEIARIKELARKVGATKISQRQESIVFFFTREAMSPEKMEKLYEQYGIAIRFSKGIEPYVTFKVGERTEKEIISKGKEFLNLCS